MSKAASAKALFWEGTDFMWKGRAVPQCTDRLLKAAELFADSGELLAAGLATSVAISSTLGLALHYEPHLAQWSSRALHFYAEHLRHEPKEFVGSTLALMKSYQELYRILLHRDQLEVARSKFMVMTALAEHLVNGFSSQSDGKALVDGFRVEGEITGPWQIVDLGGNKSYTHFERVERAGTISFRIDPAFELLVATGDYTGAWDICTKFPTAFDSPGLKGWRLAIEALVTPAKASQLFFSAADWLHVDDPRKTGILHGVDDFANVDTWEPHFRCRGYLSLAANADEQFESHLSEAGKFASKFKAIRKPEVERFDFLVKALLGLIELGEGIDPATARNSFVDSTQLLPETYDSIILEFIENAVFGLTELQRDRREGLSVMRRAIFALNRLPFLGSSDGRAFEIALDRHTLSLLDGQTRNWIYRRLESVGDERQLRHVLLRLFQEQIPQYAQIRHGPIEYGKDIAVVTNESDGVTLRWYQVKCGDVTRSKWYGEIRPQLEQMFQVPMPEFQVPTAINKRLGILVWNGHISPHVEDIVSAWQLEQRQAFGREYVFMNVDSIVNYVIDTRLVGALRSALNEVSPKVKDRDSVRRKRPQGRRHQSSP